MTSGNPQIMPRLTPKTAGSKRATLAVGCGWCLSDWDDHIPVTTSEITDIRLVHVN